MNIIVLYYYWNNLYSYTFSHSQIASKYNCHHKSKSSSSFTQSHSFLLLIYGIMWLSAWWEYWSAALLLYIRILIRLSIIIHILFVLIIQILSIFNLLVRYHRIWPWILLVYLQMTIIGNSWRHSTKSCPSLIHLIIAAFILWRTWLQSLAVFIGQSKVDNLCNMARLSNLGIALFSSV